MSFECDHCGCKNNEVQSGDKIQEKGVLIQVCVTSPIDLSRQIIKSDYATVKIPEIELEVPPQSKRGGKFFQYFYGKPIVYQCFYVFSRNN